MGEGGEERKRTHGKQAVTGKRKKKRHEKAQTAVLSEITRGVGIEETRKRRRKSAFKHKRGEKKKRSYQGMKKEGGEKCQRPGKKA